MPPTTRRRAAPPVTAYVGCVVLGLFEMLALARSRWTRRVQPGAGVDRPLGRRRFP